jgi:hypothetical protein
MSTLVGGAAPTTPIPRSPEVKAFLYDNAIIGETRRFRQLDRYEAFYKGTIYRNHEYDWWGYPADNMETISSEIQVPYGFTQPALAMTVRDKRPTAPYRMCQAIVERFTGLLFSDARRPTVTWENDPQTEDFMLAAMEQARFWPMMREARTMGGAMGSVLVTAHLRPGEQGARFALEVHNPKHCQIVWKDRRSFQVSAVLKLYKYPVEEDVFDEKTREWKGTRMVDYLYRRIITEDDDTVFKPTPVGPGMDLRWDRDAIESTVNHKLGFFPGAWVQNMPVVDDYDGNPDCHGAWETFDTIDRLISQVNKGTLLNLDPTLAINADPREVEMLGGVRKGSDNAIMLGASGNARYVEMAGSGVTVANEVISRLESNVLNVTRCVIVDPEKISGSAQSAKAIEYIYEPMLLKADELRAQYGDMLIIPILKVMEKIARKFVGKTVELPPAEDGTPRIGKYTFDLPPKVVAPSADAPEGEEAEVQERSVGKGGYIRLAWGPYFAPTENDKQLAITNAVAALAGGVIDEDTAVRSAAAVFGVRDPAAMLKRIREQKEAATQAAFAGLDTRAMFGDAEPPAANEIAKTETE